MATATLAIMTWLVLRYWYGYHRAKFFKWEARKDRQWYRHVQQSGGLVGYKPVLRRPRPVLPPV